MLKAEDIQIIYEISMDIGTSLDLNQMLRTAIITVLRKLNCIIGVILKKKMIEDVIIFRRIFSIPRNLNNNEDYNIALEEIPKKISKSEENEFYKRLPITKKGKSNVYFHIIELPDFGLILLIKSGEKLKSQILKSLIPINLKLAYNCNACFAQQQLLSSEERYRNAFNRANFFQDLLTHDMRNILHSLNAASDLGNLMISENPLGVIKLFDIIRNQIARAKSLISNVQKFVQIEDMNIEIKKVDLIKIINEVINNMKLRFQEKEIQVIFNDAGKYFEVNGGEFLYDVIENLVANAIIHNERTIITISINLTQLLSDKKKQIKVEIIDNGNGIRDDLKEKIFLRAFEYDKSTGGLGIGLSLVKKIIDLYGGKIWVENRVDEDYTKGSNFIIILNAN